MSRIYNIFSVHMVAAASSQALLGTGYESELLVGFTVGFV
jgi:hypothetical protein